MAAPHHLIELSRHMAWADATVWSAVSRAEAAGDAKVSDRLHHVHLVQHLFLQAWRGEDPSIREKSDFPDAAALARWGREALVAVQAFLGATDAATLEQELRVPWAAYYERASGRRAGRHTAVESMLQVALHTAHHRGQVCQRLRELGHDPPTVDFILWLWADRPGADWSWMEE